MGLLVSFIVFNAINVVLQTIKSLVTIKGGKTSAALVNAIVYAFYTYIVVLTMCELDLLTKCMVVGICNFIGVWVVKWLEEKMRKDKLWEIKISVRNRYAAPLHADLDRKELSYNCKEVGKHTIFTVYTETQADSAYIREVIKMYHAKYFANETKIL